MLVSNAANSPQVDVALSGQSTFDADINYDGKVGIADIVQFENLLGTHAGEANYSASADPTGSGSIDMGDFGIMNAQYGLSIAQTTPAKVAAAATPVTASAAAPTASTAAVATAVAATVLLTASASATDTAASVVTFDTTFWQVRHPAIRWRRSCRGPICAASCGRPGRPSAGFAPVRGCFGCRDRRRFCRGGKPDQFRGVPSRGQPRGRNCELASKWPFPCRQPESSSGFCCAARHAAGHLARIPD